MDTSHTEPKRRDTHEINKNHTQAIHWFRKWMYLNKKILLNCYEEFYLEYCQVVTDAVVTI